MLELEVVLADGSVVTLGSDTGEQAGPDLRGVFLGSEGTLGITTKVVVRLLRTPESVRTLLADFPSVRAAGDVVSDIVGAGIVPAAVEMMDTLAIEAAEEAVHAGYTVGVPAALVVELDGPPSECDAQFEQVKEICERHGCTRLHIAGSPEERAAIWRGRKAAFAAVGRISPDYFVQDGVVPRTRLAEVLGRIADDGRRGRAAGGERLPRGRREPAPAGALQRRRGRDRPGRAPVRGRSPSCASSWAGRCRASTGSAPTRRARCRRCSARTTSRRWRRVRTAFDPHGLCNPGKVLPTPRLCGERPGKYRPHPLEEAGVIERL